MNKDLDDIKITDEMIYNTVNRFIESSNNQTPISREFGEILAATPRNIKLSNLAETMLYAIFIIYYPMEIRMRRLDRSVDYITGLLDDLDLKDRIENATKQLRLQLITNVEKIQILNKTTENKPNE